MSAFANPSVPAVRQRPRSAGPGPQLFRSRIAFSLNAVFTGSVVMSVMLFVFWGGIGTVVDLGSALRGAGMVAGLVGTDLVLVMLVLAARIPFLDRVIGHDIAMAHHRRLGKPALYLILAHAVLLIVGGALVDGFDVVRETAKILGDSDTFLAFFGLLLFVAVVVSSVIAVVHKFSYEAWYVIHLASYIAIVLALPHQSIPGAVLADGSWRYTYWLTLYGIAFGSLLLFRAVLPVARSVYHGLHVTGIERIAPGVTSIHLTGRRLDRLKIRGGQYALWRFWTGPTWWHAHPISFSAGPTRETLRITVRDLGRGSKALSEVKIGSRVSFSGPLGMFTNETRTAPYVTMIAAGIGVTHLRAMLEDATLRPGEATVVLRHSGSDPTYLWDEINDLARMTGSKVIHMKGPRSASTPTWMSDEMTKSKVAIMDLIDNLALSDIYVCGPTLWAELVVQDARAAGVPPHQIHIERFDW